MVDSRNANGWPDGWVLWNWEGAGCVMGTQLLWFHVGPPVTCLLHATDDMGMLHPM